MKLNAGIFREYDIRGIAGKDLTEEVFERIGGAFAAYMRKKKTQGRKHNRIAVGRDGRLTSKAFGRAFIDGLVNAGTDVAEIGEVPTGMTYFAMQALDVDAAVMITGSHNPKEYNGLKIAVGPGTIHGEEIQKLRKLAEQGEFPQAKGPVTITRVDISPQYIQRIARDIKLKRKLRVVVDAGNGIGGRYGVPLYEKLGCEVIPIYCEVDGNFPNHHPDPTLPETLKKLISTVRAKKADLGIAFEGDADRIGAVDELGNVIAGDRLLILFARSVLEAKKGAAIIGDVKCSRTLFDDVAKHGGKPIMWKTGHSLIKDAMKTHKAELAGEMSGHIFFKHRWYGFDDAIYAGARLLELLAAGSKSLSQHLADVPKTFVTDEIRIDTAEAKKFGIVERATKYFKDEMKLNVNTIDGARIEFPDGWGLLRASNTSPVLVMRCEADTKKRLAEICALVGDKVNELNR